MLRSKSTRRSLTLALLAILSVPALALAQPEGDERGDRRGPGGQHRGGKHKPEPGRFIERYGDELGIEAETRVEIQTIADDSRQRAEQLREQTRAEHLKMRALLSQASPDEAAVMAQSDRLDALKSQQRKNRLEAMLAIRKRLTPEQREQLSAMREERRAARGGPGTGTRRGFVEDGTGGESGRPGKRRGGRSRGCREDIRTLCPAAETGRERLQCLDSQWDSLSDGCRAAFDGGGGRGFRQGPGGEAPQE